MRPEDCRSMAEVRAEIDRVDAALMALLAERMSYVARVPELKRAEGLSAAAPARVADVLMKVRARAEASGIDPRMVEGMWRVMIEAIVAQEQQVLGLEGEDG